MPLQPATVRVTQAEGLIGELHKHGPTRSHSWRLNSADPADNVFGRGFRLAAGNTAGAALTTAFIGILSIPKEHVLRGTTAGTLAPSLTLRNGSSAELVTMGFAIIQNGSAFAGVVGDPVYTLDATGEIVLTAALATLIPGAQVAFEDIGANIGEIGVIQLT